MILDIAKPNSLRHTTKVHRGMVMLTFTKFAIAAALASLLVISPSALAEVFKCVDATTGKVTFTDVACPDKGSGDYVHVRPTNVDAGYSAGDQRRQSQSQSSDDQKGKPAWLRSANRVAAEQEAEARQREVDRIYREAEFTKDPSKRSSLLRQAEAAQRSVGSSERPSAPAPLPAPEPTMMTNCDGAGCWDNTGSRYNKGAGNTYFRSDGKTCQAVGGSMDCN